LLFGDHHRWQPEREKNDESEPCSGTDLIFTLYKPPMTQHRQRIKEATKGLAKTENLARYLDTAVVRSNIYAMPASICFN
jgi:hypothetical protein